MSIFREGLEGILDDAKYDLTSDREQEGFKGESPKEKGGTPVVLTSERENDQLDAI